MSYGGGADVSFGTAGYLPIPSNNFDAISRSTTTSAIQSDGKIVVAGTILSASPTGSTVFTFSVARYDANGMIDQGFGSAGFFSDEKLSYNVFNPLESRIASAEAMAIQPDGKIVVVGEVEDVAKVIRLNADGTLDPNFGSGGIVTLGTIGGTGDLIDFAESMALLPSGEIAVAGFYEPTAGIEAPAVELLAANGSIVAGFNNGGLALVPIPAGAETFPPLGPLDGHLATNGSPAPVSVVAQRDGEIIVGASAVLTTTVPFRPQTEIVVTKFSAAGTLDPNYGTNGQAVIAASTILPTGTSAVATTMSLQSAGQLIIGGAITLGAPTSSPLGPDPQILALSLDAVGHLDPSFGVGGAYILAGFGSFNSVVGAEAIQADNKIVLGDANSANFIRLNAHGFPDVEFGVAGRSIYPFTPSGARQGSSSISVQADGKIVATQGGSGGGLIRLLGLGAINDYDNDGHSDPAVYNTATGVFTYYSTARGTTTSFPFGAGNGQSLPAPGAYDGGGNSEVGVYLSGPTQDAFANLTPTFGYGPTTYFGVTGAGNALPAPGDYDFSGKTEYAVYLPQTGAFAYRPGGGGPDVTIPFGTPGAGKSIPAPGDYFGTGQTDFAVYLPDLGAFAIRNPTTGQDLIIPFGTPGAGKSIPVPGDYDGLGKTELAVYLPDTGALIYRRAGGGPDVVQYFGIPGKGQTLPAPGDYDGSGKTEVAAYFPTLGLFAFRPSNGGPDVLFPLGNGGSTVPFVLASATDTGAAAGPGFGIHAASVEIPLTPDVLDSLAGTTTVKKAVKHS